MHRSSLRILQEQISALRQEGAEALWLCAQLSDAQAIADLQGYAAALEAEAQKLERRQAQAALLRQRSRSELALLTQR